MPLIAAAGVAEAGAVHPAPDGIGTAREEADGTIVLLLRAEGDAGAIGDALFRYRPSDPDYRMVKAHVGPIPSGRSVVVRPFPSGRRRAR